jgi:hypothetical protein
MRHMLVLLVVLGGCTAIAPVSIAETEVPSDQEAVSVSSEATGQPCGAVSLVNDVATGGCQLHATSATTVDAVSHTIFGESVTARCNNEYSGAVNGSGEGRIGASQIVLSNPASGGIDCTGAGAVRACTEAEAAALGGDHQANWHLRIVEEKQGGNGLWIDARICLQNLNPFNSTVGGSVWLRVTEDGSGHPTSASSTDHRLRDAEVPLSADAEFTGGWNLEGDGIEVTH